jgi:hypothetical protein
LRWKWREYSTIAAIAEIAGIAVSGAHGAVFVTISTVPIHASKSRMGAPF